MKVEIGITCQNCKFRFSTSVDFCPSCGKQWWVWFGELVTFLDTIESSFVVWPHSQFCLCDDCKPVGAAVGGEDSSD